MEKIRQLEAPSNKLMQMDEIPSNGSQVRRMFAGRSILITGGSGFIGRVLIEKLLRCYPEIKQIYLLLRPKKGQLPEERLQKHLLRVPLFDRLRALDGGRRLDKLQVVSGDIGQPRLGLSSDDLGRLLADETLAFVFHSAATIKFDEPLKVSVQLNLIATQTVLQFCHQISHRLVGFCHVSTCYVNADLLDNKPIKERLYPMRDQPEQLIRMAQSMDENLMQILKPHLVGDRPNTYTYTKALAEHLISREAGSLPVVIVRPSIVVASLQEPFAGWVDNLNGPTGMILAIGKGLLRSLHVNSDGKADLIPVDKVVNTMVASTYFVAKKRGTLELGRRSHLLTDDSCIMKSASMVCKSQLDSCRQADHSPVPIVHCNSGSLNPCSWGSMEENVFPIIRKYPSSQVLRYPFGTFKTSYYHDLAARVIAHLLPALFIDLLCVLMGRKRQLMQIYHKLHGAIAALSHFLRQNYNFETKNIDLINEELESEEDKRQLSLEIRDIDWAQFWDHYVLGARRYVLREPDETLPEARRSFRRAFYIEMVFRTLLVGLAASLVSRLFADYITLPRLLSSFSIICSWGRASSCE